MKKIKFKNKYATPIKLFKFSKNIYNLSLKSWTNFYKIFRQSTKNKQFKIKYLIINFKYFKNLYAPIIIYNTKTLNSLKRFIKKKDNKIKDKKIILFTP